MIRRPGAARAKVRAAVPKRAGVPKGAARPHHGAVRGGAAAPVRRARRRPAAGVEEAPEEVAPEDLEQKFNRGEDVLVDNLPLRLLAPGLKVVGAKGVYSGEEVSVAGKVVKVELEGSSAEVVLHPTGTNSENLLKYITGLQHPLLRLHLCDKDCDQLRSNPDLVHVKQLRKGLAGKEEVWEDNLVTTDELQHLRRAQEQWNKPEKEKEGEESSSSRKKKKKKAKKKKDKKKDESKAKKIGGKSVAQKPLSSLYSGTGMDPEYADRKRLLRKMKKRLKSSKESSSSETSDSSSSTEEEEMDRELLQDRSKIQRLAQMAPGVLSSEAIKAMKKHVMMAAGQPWELEEKSLPPIACQYSRQFVLTRASPPIQREVITLSHIIDMMAMGRAAQALDVATQRLKSIELSLSGHTWQAAQKIEVVGTLEAQLATRAEVEVANKELRLDQRSKGGGMGGTSSWGKDKGRGKNSGKEKEKGKNDKGKGGGKAEKKSS